MSAKKHKSLDEFSDESEQFESQFERLFEAAADESARKQMMEKIADWLQDCAKQGRFIPLASADRRAFRSLLERWNSRLRRKGFRIEGIDSLADFDPNAGVVLTGECPYPGLDPYTCDYRLGFFGREELISSCVSHLEQEGNQILMIVGASGAGKSSVALAGILPRLMELHGEAWLFGPRFTPGSHPLAGLAKSVAQVIGKPDQATEIQRDFAAEPEKALFRVAELCRNKPLMLIIDQFEELLTLCRDASEQSAFAQVLCALSDPSASVNGFSCQVLLTLRTDHLARFEDNKTLASLYMRVKESLIYLPAIGFNDIKRAIKAPADLVGLRFVPEGLIDQLASQTASLSNGLPLLQFSLRRLWDTRPKNESGEPLDLVTEQMVKDLPDVQSALGKVAEDVFSEFSIPQQKICERLLQELLVLDETFEEPLRRRRNENELLKILNQRFPQDPGGAAKVIDEFVAAGLLRRFGHMPNSQIEVSHEALLRRWDRIYGLVTGVEVKERLHLIKHIGIQSADWVNHDKTSDYLTLKGERLESALKYDSDGWLAEPESRAYVNACKMLEEGAKKEAERAMLAEKARKEAELQAQQAKKARDNAELQAKQAELIANQARITAKESRLHSYIAIVIAGIAIVFTLGMYWYLKGEEMERIAQASDLVSYGFYYLQADDSEKAEKNFNDAKELVKDHSIVAKLGLGQICLDNKNYEEAIKYFDELISSAEKKEKEGDSKEDPTLYTYYYRKGIAFHELGKYAEAKDAFKKAIKLMEKRNLKENIKDRNIIDYYCQLGLSYLYLDETDDSEKAFSEGIRIGKEMAPKGSNGLFGRHEACNHHGMGQLSMRRMDFTAARINFENAIKSLERNEKDIPTYKLSLAQASLALEDYPGAEKECKDAIARFNLTPDEKGKAHTLFGNALAGQGKYLDAIGAFRKAIETKQDDAFVALYLADAFTENKNFPEAEKYLNKAEEDARRDPQLQKTEAREVFDKKFSEVKEKLRSQQLLVRQKKQT